jgi:hypothetical protein
MAKYRWIVLVLAFGLSFAARATDLFWQPFDTLPPADRSLAEQALAGLFGDNPDYWPDWAEPRALLLPVATGKGNVLVVRQPRREPCGQFYYSVFGPPAGQGGRAKLGDDLCAGDLQAAGVPGRPLPDLILSEGRVRDPQTGQWRRLDQHVRWTGSKWVRLVGR